MNIISETIEKVKVVKCHCPPTLHWVIFIRALNVDFNLILLVTKEHRLQHVPVSIFQKMPLLMACPLSLNPYIQPQSWRLQNHVLHYTKNTGSSSWLVAKCSHYSGGSPLSHFICKSNHSKFQETILLNTNKFFHVISISKLALTATRKEITRRRWNFHKARNYSLITSISHFIKHNVQHRRLITGIGLVYQ